MLVSIIFLFLVTLCFGLPLVLIIAPKQKPAAIIGTSYLLGIGLFTFLMFISNIAGLRFSLLNEILLLFAVSFPLVLLTKRKMKIFFSRTLKDVKNMRLTSIEKIMLGVMIFVVFSSLLNTLYWPVYLWDSVVLYDFRAHVFATTGFMKDAFVDGYYINYPLLTSLAHTIVYLADGKYPQFIHSFFFLSLILTFYGLLREFTSRKFAIFFTLLLVISEQIFYHSLISYVNLAFGVYVSLSAIYLFFWDRKKKVGYLILSALFANLSTWTRFTEPFWLGLFIIVFFVSVYRKRFYDILIYSFFLFPIRETWKIYKGIIGGQEASVALEVSEYFRLLISSLNITKLTQVTRYLYRYAVMPWGAVFYLFLISFVLLYFLKKHREYFLMFLITFFLIGILVAGTFAFSIKVPYLFAIGDVTTRLTIFYIPLFIFCIALVFEELRKVIKKK